MSWSIWGHLQIVLFVKTVFDFRWRFAAFLKSNFILDVVDFHSLTDQNLLLFLHCQINIFQTWNMHSCAIFEYKFQVLFLFRSKCQFSPIVIANCIQMRRPMCIKLFANNIDASLILWQQILQFTQLATICLTYGHRLLLLCAFTGRIKKSFQITSRGLFNQIGLRTLDCSIYQFCSVLQLTTRTLRTVSNAAFEFHYSNRQCFWWPAMWYPSNRWYSSAVRCTLASCIHSHLSFSISSMSCGESYRTLESLRK